MSYKSIIVHVDAGAASERRMEIGVRFARRFGSRLVGLYVVPIPELASVEAAELSPAEVAKRMAARDARHRAEAFLGRLAASSDVREVQFRAPAGDPIDSAIAESRCADLTILAQPDRDDHAAGFARRLAESVTLGCGGPVLLVPYATASAEPGSNVMIAWDGGREAARAVRDALPLLRDAKRVTVVSTSPDPGAAEAVQRSYARLAAYVAVHAVETQFKRLDVARHETGEAMLSRAADLGADLIVMGAYGHARVREIVLGGVTRTMFEAMTIPVFMSH